MQRGQKEGVGTEWGRPACVGTRPSEPSPGPNHKMPIKHREERLTE